MMEKISTQLLSVGQTDAEQLNALSIQLGYNNNVETLFKRTVAIVKSNNDCLFVVKVDKQIVAWAHAFIALRVESPLFTEIAGLVVDEQCHKQGIGKILINSIKDWSNNKGIKKITVRCNVIRTESHKFYKNIGFAQNKQQMVFELFI